MDHVNIKYIKQSSHCLYWPVPHTDTWWTINLSIIISHLMVKMDSLLVFLHLLQLCLILFSMQQPEWSCYNVSWIVSLLCLKPSNGSSFLSKQKPHTMASRFSISPPSLLLLTSTSIIIALIGCLPLLEEGKLQRDEMMFSLRSYIPSA